MTMLDLAKAIAELNAERDGLRQQMVADRKQSLVWREQVRVLREAINWYADEARACAKNSHSGKHSAPEALLASVTVLALDDGKRADAALAATKEQT